MIPRKKTHQTATQGRKVRNYGTGINYGAAVEGGPMPVIMGTNQVAPTLVYFNPGPGTVEPYLGKNYACLWGLCEGVIDSVPRYWRDTKRYIGTPQTAVILPCRDAWVHGTADPTLDWTVFGLPADANTLGRITAEETTAITAPDGTTNHLTKLWWNRGWVYIFGGHNTTVQGPTGNAKYIESPRVCMARDPNGTERMAQGCEFRRPESLGIPDHHLRHGGRDADQNADRRKLDHCQHGRGFDRIVRGRAFQASNRWHGWPPVL